MKEPKHNPVPATVSLKKVVEEIDLLFNDEWTAISTAARGNHTR